MAGSVKSSIIECSFFRSWAIYFPPPIPLLLSISSSSTICCFFAVSLIFSFAFDGQAKPFFFLLMNYDCFLWLPTIDVCAAHVFMLLPDLAFRYFFFSVIFVSLIMINDSVVRPFLTVRRTLNRFLSHSFSAAYCKCETFISVNRVF